MIASSPPAGWRCAGTHQQRSRENVKYVDNTMCTVAGEEEANIQPPCMQKRCPADSTAWVVKRKYNTQLHTTSCSYSTIKNEAKHESR